MDLVVGYGWQKEEAEAARIIAETLGILVFEARQKIAGGGPVVLASFADSTRAADLAQKLCDNAVPALVVDVQAVREEKLPMLVRRFQFGEQALHIEFISGETGEIDYPRIALLLSATCILGEMQTKAEETKRKFSLGKTLLAGGIPMTKKVKSKTIRSLEERDETLWLYDRDQSPTIFERATLKYDGLGDAMQMTKNLNFAYLKQELQRRAPEACYDGRLLERSKLVRLLGPSLSPETDLDLAFEILSQSLK